MKPQWIDCGRAAIFIGPFWMGSPEQIAETQAAIDEECALYEEASASEEASTHDDLIDKSINTEIGETHYDRQ